MVSRWAKGGNGYLLVVNNEATLERTGTGWAQGV